MHRWTRALRLPSALRQTVRMALQHDALNLAQSAAYSAIVALFPALIVSAAVLALLPDVTPVKVEIGNFFDQVLPADVIPLLTSYFAASSDSPRPFRALIVAAIVSISGASSVLAILMEGLRRAEALPADDWTFWQRRRRAFVLVPVSLLPLAVATVLVVFGRLLTAWLAASMAASMEPTFFTVALIVRWSVALAGVVGLTATIYHLGTSERRAWLESLPGAVMATTMWFFCTLIFGWYVTRLANYTQVYGSLGTGIALLIWLYLVFLSVLCGAEFNVEWVRQDGAGRASLPAAGGDVQVKGEKRAQRNGLHRVHPE